MKSESVFSLNKLKGSNTLKAYEEDLQTVAKSLYLRFGYMSFD